MRNNDKCRGDWNGEDQSIALSDYSDTDNSNSNSNISEQHPDDECGDLFQLRKSWGPHVILWIGVLAAACTFAASWSCNTFSGADGSLGVGGYGIWSLEDSEQRCQLWSVLFFANELDTSLQAARYMSMTAMLGSLTTIAILSQLLPWGRIASWMVASALIYWLFRSLIHRSNWIRIPSANWEVFIVWSAFFLFSHLWMMFFTKRLLVQHYSPSTLWNLARPLMLVCSLGASGIFFIMASNVCTCDGLRKDDLEYTGNGTQAYSSMPLLTSDAGTEHCSGQCLLGPRSPIAIASPCLWFVAWLMTKWISLETPTQPYKHKKRLEAEDATLTVSEEDEEDPNSGAVKSAKSDTIVESMSESSERDIAMQASEVRSKSVNSMMVVDSSFQLSAVPKGGNDSKSSKKKLNDDESSSISSMSTNNHSSTILEPTHWRKVELAFWGIVSMFELFVIFVLIASYVENKRAAMAPDTSYNFITDVVCAFDQSGAFETFDTAQQAQQAGCTIAHCGACGDCSNPSDIEVFVETRKTLAHQAKKCSIQAIFGNDEELIDCLENEIGFTRSCTTCWAENMRNTAKQCKWTCLSSILMGFDSQNTIDDAQDYKMLSQCVFCDEKRSGPAFVECSGVARRRLGIPSEFERDPTELCTKAEVNYLGNSWNEVFL